MSAPAPQARCPGLPPQAWPFGLPPQAWPSGLPPQAWLFGPRTDVAAFLGSALASAAFAWGARRLGVVGETPLWAWVLCVLALDVAHVWSTLFRTYLDPAELRRRPALYAGAPLLAWAAGVAAYAHGPALFWRLLAYTALFHFVRQQVGWVALYGRRAGASVAERRLDAAAVYAATLGPALWWHARLPRPFWWFVEGDFVSLPAWVAPAALWGHAAVLAAWGGHQLWRLTSGRGVQVGKVLLVAATWVAWAGGIVLAPDDLTFTAMNVTLHGVPYMVLLWRYARGRAAEEGRDGGSTAPAFPGASLLRAGWPGFLLVLVALAFLEELLWDRLLWNERPQLFGPGWGALPEPLLAWVVPLLALPQATHYLLDAFIWRTSGDPHLRARLGWGAPVRPAGDGAPTVPLTAGGASPNLPRGV